MFYDLVLSCLKREMSKFWHTEEKGEIQDDRIVSTFQK